MIQQIDEALVESTYLWCYARVSNSHDAADLAQDILTAALQAVRFGKEIGHFYGWYWGMAQNRLRMYLRIKAHGAVSLEHTKDISCPDDTADALLSAEEVGELNHAISRLSALHRESIILYYLRGMKITEIARMLGVPEGTVKRRLFDAKNHIRKEVTAMTHTGRSAYAPAQVNLNGGYAIPDYWNRISDLMTKQIFATCARTPRTVREIADEIGVAPIYFEEKLAWLTGERFMKKVASDRYLTDFILYPAVKKAEFNAALEEIYENIGAEITEAILSAEEKIRAPEFYGNGMPMTRLLWVLYVYACTGLSEQMREIYCGKWAEKIPKNNGKTWRLSGTVLQADETLPDVGGKHRSVHWSNIHSHYRTAQYRWVQCANLFQASPFGSRDGILTEGTVDLFMRLFSDPRMRLLPAEEETASALIRAGFLARSEGGLQATVPVLQWDVQRQLHGILRDVTAPIALRYAQTVGACAERILLPVTREDLTEEFVHWIMENACFPIGHVFRYAWDTPGLLEMPEEGIPSSLGYAVYYKH